MFFVDVISYESEQMEYETTTVVYRYVWAINAETLNL